MFPSNHCMRAGSRVARPVPSWCSFWCSWPYHSSVPVLQGLLQGAAGNHRNAAGWATPSGACLSMLEAESSSLRQQLKSHGSGRCHADADDFVGVPVLPQPGRQLTGSMIHWRRCVRHSLPSVHTAARRLRKHTPPCWKLRTSTTSSACLPPGPKRVTSAMLILRLPASTPCSPRAGDSRFLVPPQARP